MMEVGAYNTDWADIPMGPEQAIEAHRRVRGGLMLPIHWGMFNLAFHSWTKSAERVLAAAERAGVDVAIPRPGQSIVLTSPPEMERWWPVLPWLTAEENPIVSSGMETLGAQ